MTYLDVLWSYLLVSAPYLLLGFFVSGIINQFVPTSKLKSWLGAHRFSSIFKASLIGVPLPLCSCSVIPTAVTLKKNGASNAATSAFLISTPESGIDSISITYALMDLPMTIIRPIAAFCSAFFAGTLQFFLNKENVMPLEEEASSDGHCCHSKKEEVKKIAFSDRIKQVFQYGFGKLSDDIAGWLTIGILLGAMIDYIVPENYFASLSMLEDRLMILVIGIPLYICASASTPIAASLMLKGLSPGSALLLLLVGPSTNISNIAVLQKYIGKRGVILNIFSIVIVALGFSFLVDYLYSRFFTVQINEILLEHSHSGSWWQSLSAAILIVLLIKGIYLEEVKPRFKSKREASCH
ncbi:MAG: hypothetical protein CME65_14725 [Halobacteriovoraceae bacterium]|nr:hypothetical protein [Halobacteriovoraceae bacterium]|tara:strand:+ start:1486 stop:2544 length:1059 start_codon:yes stop_codon:yes gene_type:complete